MTREIYLLAGDIGGDARDAPVLDQNIRPLFPVEIDDGSVCDQRFHRIMLPRFPLRLYRTGKQLTSGDAAPFPFCPSLHFSDVPAPRA